MNVKTFPTFLFQSLFPFLQATLSYINLLSNFGSIILLHKAIKTTLSLYGRASIILSFGSYILNCLYVPTLYVLFFIWFDNSIKFWLKFISKFIVSLLCCLEHLHLLCASNSFSLFYHFYSSI